MHPGTLPGAERVDAVSLAVRRIDQYLTRVPHGVALTFSLTNGYRHAGRQLRLFKFVLRAGQSYELVIEGTNEGLESFRRIAIRVDRHEDYGGVASDFWEAFEDFGELSQVNGADVRTIGIPEVEKRESAVRLRSKVVRCTIRVGQGERRL